MSEKIGFVGLGRMGTNMARRLKEVNYDVVGVYDVVIEIAQDLAEELECATFSDLSEMIAEVDVVMTVVTDDAAMYEIFDTEKPSLLTNDAAGKLFINCATVSPSVHVEVEKRANAIGASVIEACMASSIPQAREGTLYLMCAGQRGAYRRAEPILRELSSNLRYIGTSGSAAKVKALVNMVMNINTTALAEGLGLGKALGLDLEVLREVFSQTGANSRVLETDAEDMINKEFDCYFSAAHAAKDSGIACSLAEEVGLELPLAKATRDRYEEMKKRGYGELDKSGVALLTFPEE